MLPLIVDERWFVRYAAGKILEEVDWEPGSAEEDELLEEALAIDLDRIM